MTYWRGGGFTYSNLCEAGGKKKEKGTCVLERKKKWEGVQSPTQLKQHPAEIFYTF